MKQITISAYDLIKTLSNDSGIKTYKMHSGNNMLVKFTEIIMSDIIFNELVLANEIQKIQIYDKNDASYHITTVIPRTSMKNISNRCINIINRILNESLYNKYDTRDGKEFVVNTIITISSFYRLIYSVYKAGGTFFLEVKSIKE